jgi:hypothetical protein
MSRWLPGFGVPVLGLLLLPIVACDQATIASNPTGPTPLNATVDVRTSFDFEPATLRAETLPGSCGSHHAFGLRLGVKVRGDDDVIVTSLRFSYFDRRGSQGLPTVIPIPDLSTTAYPFSDIPSSSAIPIPGVAPLPNASPIPIPGGPPLTGVLIRPGSHPRLDYLLRFGCVEIGGGSIVVVIGTADRNGRRRSTEVRARVEA